MSDCSATPERIDQCPATPDRSASTVKSPEPSVSPPPNCPICLGKCRNQCFTDSCLHKFCFKCLLEWSKVKPECPLCKQSFKSIIHNVKSIDQFEEYLVQQSQPPIPVILPLSNSDGQRSSQHSNNSRGSVSGAQAPSRLFAHRFDVFLNDISRLRSGVYSAHLQVNPDSAFHQLMLNSQYQQPFSNDIFTTGNMLLLWRQYIYDKKLYALPVIDITGRFRECSARFYRNNPAQIHRLMPWLNRDLACLLRDSPYDVSFVLHIIGQLITVYNINSAEFRRRCTLYFGSRTSHFLHEFLTFAKSPYDMVGYDRHSHYAPYEEIVISSSSNTSSASESDDGLEVPLTQLRTHSTTNPTDINSISRGCPQQSSSIILGLLANGAATVASANLEHTYALPQTSNTITSSNLSRVDNVVLSSSSTNDECEFVMEQKPPHLRTPELVSLNSESDSDVIFVSEDKPKAERASTRALRSTSSRRPPTPYYNFSSDEENVPSSRKPATPFGKSSSEDDNKALSVLKKEFQGTDSRSNNNGKQSQVKSNNNETINSSTKRSGDKDEYNNGASTSASISYLNKSRIKPERPQRLYYKKKRKAIKSIFESSSSDEDSKKEYINYKLKNNRSGSGSGKNYDDEATTETYDAQDSDTDDSSWSQSKNTSGRYQKRHKLSKKRRSEMLKKRLKKELEKL